MYKTRTPTSVSLKAEKVGEVSLKLKEATAAEHN